MQHSDIADTGGLAWKEAEKYVVSQIARHFAGKKPAELTANRAKAAEHWSKFISFINNEIDPKEWSESITLKRSIENTANILGKWASAHKDAKNTEKYAPIYDRLLQLVTTSRGNDAENNPTFNMSMDVFTSAMFKIIDTKIKNLTNSYKTISEDRISEALFDKFSAICSSQKYEFESFKKFSALFEISAHNKVNDLYRVDVRDYRNQHKTIDILGYEKPSKIYLPSDLVEERDGSIDDVSKIMLRYLPKLIEGQQIVLMKRHFEGKPFGQIADEMDISVNTALGSYRYGIANLAKISPELANIYRNNFGDIDPARIGEHYNEEWADQQISLATREMITNHTSEVTDSPKTKVKTIATDVIRKLFEDENGKYKERDIHEKSELDKKYISLVFDTANTKLQMPEGTIQKIFEGLSLAMKKLGPRNNLKKLEEAFGIISDVLVEVKQKSPSKSANTQLAKVINIKPVMTLVERAEEIKNKYFDSELIAGKAKADKWHYGETHAMIKNLLTGLLMEDKYNYKVKKLSAYLKDTEGKGDDTIASFKVDIAKLKEFARIENQQQRQNRKFDMTRLK